MHERKHRLRHRILTALLGLVTAVAGLQLLVAPPAAAGQLGLTIEVRGAAKVTVIEGSVEDGASRVCDFRDSLDDRVVNVCPRIRSSAVLSASVWLRIEPLVSDTDEWRAGAWAEGGCDEVRLFRGTQFDCRIESASFGSTERRVRATADDVTVPEMTSYTQRGSTSQELTTVHEFSATQGTFECSTDRGRTWTACSSPHRQTWPAPGRHAMVVRAVDQSGNLSTSRSSDFTVLDTYLVSGPPATTASRTARFEVASPEAEALQCSLDGAPYAFCAMPGTPFELTGLSSGPHELRVYGADRGTKDEIPLVHRWSVDARPQTTLDQVEVTGRTARVHFSSPTATSFSCRMVGPEAYAFDWSACHSPVLLEGLPDGSWTFEVRGSADGEDDLTPATGDFTIAVLGGGIPTPDPGTGTTVPEPPATTVPVPTPTTPATPHGPTGPSAPTAPSSVPVLPSSAVVVEVVDADTLVVRDGTRRLRVDLAGTTAPRVPRCHAAAARASLARLARAGRAVRLVPVTGSRSTGASPWRVLVRGRDVALAQLSRGYVRYDRSDAPRAQRSAYADAQKRARAERRGTWGGC